MSVAVNTQPAAPPDEVTPAVELDADEVLGSPAETSEGYSLIPLKQLIASKTNPRKAFDETELDELADSIRQHGVLQPILVRPYSWSGHVSACLNPTPREVEARYEIVCGERRYRAATRAGNGIKAIPAVIRGLTDQQALEIQIIENLQRKDVSALEEAEGLRQLLDSLQAEQPQAGQRELVQTIAQKIGKSVRYVYARIALNNLIPEIQHAIAKGVLTPSHGDLLAAYSPEQQREIYAHRFCQYDENMDHYQEMVDRERQGEVVPESERVSLADLSLYETDRLPSVRDLKSALIARGEDLKKAAWKWNKEVGEGTPDRPLCLGCEFNSASMEGGDQKHPRCTNSECFARKMKYFIEIELQYLREKTGKAEVRVAKDYPHKEGVFDADTWKKAPVGSCENVAPGLIVNYSGEWMGVLSVCVNKKCKVHFGSNAKPESPEEAKRRAEQKEREAAVRRENEIRARLLEALIAQTKALTPDLLRAFILDLVDEWDLKRLDNFIPNSQSVLQKAKTDSPEFAKAIAGYLASAHAKADEWDGPDSGKKTFHETLQQLGLDWKKLRAKFETELYAQLAAKDQPAKPKTSAELASLPVTPGSLSKARKLTKKKSVPKKQVAKAAKKAGKKGSRK